MYLENLYSSDLETEIFMRENVIELDECQNDIIDGLNMYQESVLFESEDSDKSDGILLKICEKIGKMINKIKDFISSFFKSIGMNMGDKLTAEDYISSETAKVRLDADYAKICDDIDHEIAESHKIVSKLAKLMGIDPVVMKRMTDKGQKAFKTTAPVILSTAAAVIVGNKIKKSILKNDKVVDDIDKARKGIERKLKRKDKITYDKLKKDGHPIMAELNKLTAMASERSKKLTVMFNDVTKKLNTFRKK